MKDLADSGMTMLVVTHEMQFAREVGDDLIFIDEGRIVEEGRPADVLDQPQEQRTRRFLRRSLQLVDSLTSCHGRRRRSSMRRIMLVTVALALAAAALAAWGGASPSTSSGTAAPAQAKKPKLPPLPANIKERGRWIIGVKCDVPPFGYINVKGQNAGFDVEIARWFARYAFGSATRVSFTCAPTPARGAAASDRPG